MHLTCLPTAVPPGFYMGTLLLTQVLAHALLRKTQQVTCWCCVEHQTLLC